MIETTLKTFRNDSRISCMLSNNKKGTQNLVKLISHVNSHQAFTYIQETLNYKFIDLKLFVNAITHTSFLNENSGYIEKDYERLEFLGDAFIELFITNTLMNRFSSSSEGDLSKMRACLVNGTSLACIARFLKIDEVVLVGRGEVKNNGYNKESILADVLEAVLGAVFQEAGYDEACLVFNNLITQYSNHTQNDFFNSQMLDTFDYKSRLQELTVREFGETPEYKDITMRDQSDLFTFEIYIGKKLFGQTIQNSKKNAKDYLAKQTYKELNIKH